ncbi:hypothetical protein [Sutcliffiella sp. FSL R7-0096]|uniref:hypothetical protein n=1 Tax=Sutcliffiella sp. FSL R7-0096 TaxID=2921670 RepID=UPI00315A95F5
MDIEPDEMFELHGITRDGQVIYSIDTLYGNGGSHELLEANPNAENLRCPMPNKKSTNC